MAKRVFFFIVFLSIILGSSAAYATNGDNLIAIGPISRSMGGVGIAAPQDAIGAVFANPAAMCFGPYCPSSEFNFGGTLFMPHVSASVSAGNRVFSADSDQKVFPVPAIGLSVPITNKYPYWRFGLSAFGSTGLGVDYKNTAIDRPGFFALPPPFGPQPLIAGEFTQLMIMKFAPAIAAQPTENLSLGAALHIDYSSLDLRAGQSTGFGIGVQLGAIYKPIDSVSLGLTFVSPQNVNHEDVIRLGPTNLFDLELERPLSIGAGIAYTTLAGRLLVEADVKWINWADAAGYGDFGWDNQWVFGVGAQYKVTPKLALRAGYNFGENPVETQDFVGLGTQLVQVQDFQLPRYFFETFRLIGFPAIVEHHATVGAGYDITSRFQVNLGYMHAFERSITERGTNIVGQPTTIKSTLSEDSVELGLTWRF